MIKQQVMPVMAQNTTRGKAKGLLRGYSSKLGVFVYKVKSHDIREVDVNHHSPLTILFY